MARHTTQRPAGRGGADEGAIVARQFLHAGLVARIEPAGARARRVDGEDGDPVALADDVGAERIDEAGFAYPGHTRNTDAQPSPVCGSNPSSSCSAITR